ncbi:hypothetical protein BTA51_01300 [Hahella sp. CCB-MM4]|uniref:VanZ family protein n=1 Tax=Hahella sp. (strain CCB-MM4) TaxID=1926491 RepID=UPI000B9A59A8|nr:VanZ family protein [Hahella sp. CCB-MM4]OZG75063.1 hypothetical protein BTA51_01300 [Hahella sp. CCB-MM4]
MQNLVDNFRQRLHLLGDTRWAAWLVYALLAAGYVSAIVPVEYTPVATINDKLVHITAFIGLYSLLRITHPRRSVLVLAGYMLAYGLAVEIHQWFLPYRSFSIADLLADALGIVIGFYLTQWLLKTSPISSRTDTSA